jgi:hypothetical protein
MPLIHENITGTLLKGHYSLVAADRFRLRALYETSALETLLRRDTGASVPYHGW